MLINNAFAQAAAAAPNPAVQLVPFLLIGVIMYFLIIRPTLKKNRAHKTLLESIHRGDEVWTTAGFYGIVEQVEEHTVKLKISENTVVKMLKAQISAKVQKEAEAKGKNN